MNGKRTKSLRKKLRQLLGRPPRTQTFQNGETVNEFRRYKRHLARTGR